MAFLTLTDNNNHNLLINLDLINMVQYDQGTLFIYYSVDENGPVRITNPIQQGVLTTALSADINYYDARVEGNGYFINLGSVKFTDFDQGTLFVYFFGNSGPRNSCKVTNPIVISGLLAALGSYVGGQGGGGGGLEAVYQMTKDISVPTGSCYILCEPLETNGHVLTLEGTAVLGFVL
jgi:hypothetical protein